MITRRSFLLSPAVLIAIPDRTFGKVTVEGWDAHRQRTGNELRIIVEGEDVTHRCRYADDIRGRAILYLHDKSGRIYVGDDGKIARRLYRGPVRIIERPASR